MVEKDPLRSVTIRDLARNAAAIFDELSAEGRPLVVTRGGIPVASLQPLDVQPWRPVPQANPLEAAEVEPVDLETLALSDLQRDIILWLAAPASPDDVALATRTGTKDVMMALTMLELERIVSAQWGSYGLTIKGKRVRDALQRAAEG